MKKTILFFILAMCLQISFAEDGYRLWLRYEKVSDARLLSDYKNNLQHIVVAGNSPTIKVATDELLKGLQGLLSETISNSSSTQNDATLIAGTSATSSFIASAVDKKQLAQLGNEGFLILSKTIAGKHYTIITANTDMGVLYGVFHFLRLLQTQQSIHQLNISSTPKIKLRMLDHWDNLNGSVERGYAGRSIWEWKKLPDTISQRYTDYARANASIGINAASVTNVNSNVLSLSKDYILKAKVLADIFRPYGIKLFLTARFSAPVEMGGLKTADPLDPQVQNWWKEKVKEIYQSIPDFGGFLVKANSEGQPGPQTYNRSHAEGANLLADALAPFNGMVIWRAFVYSNDKPEDRFKQAYDEFKPLDGNFRKNVVIQVKNGPIDFQPREPFHPLFGAMPKTPLVMEYQVTQEYLGFSTHLAYLATLFKECLDADTYAKGKGSTVAKVVDGSLDNYSNTGMAGVANIGSDTNWCGHPFGQANWYALGRLAWNHNLSAEQIADEWIRQTFTNDPQFISATKKIMMGSREAIVNYMTPLGLHHIMGYGNHYGPAPWYDKASRADWNPVYFHKADSIGIGFDRKPTGSNGLAQYTPEVRKQFEDPATCPEKYLLWFHHVSWKHVMKSGRTLWDEMCYKYNEGVDSVRDMQKTWNSLEKFIDKDRFQKVQGLLATQEKEAVWWRDACLLYFQTFSKMPIPAAYEKPKYTLQFYEQYRALKAP